jgi:glutamate dehydrogenase
LPLFQPFLVSYFPPKLAEKYTGQIGKHQLRREIIATVVTNAIINQAGTTLLVGLGKETATPIDELVVRYFMCDELLGGRALRAAIHGGDYKIAAADQYAGLMALEEAHRSLLRWWVWNDATWHLAPEDVAKTKTEVTAAAAALVAALEGSAKLAYEARAQELAQKGFPTDAAVALARTPLIREVFAVISASRDAKLTLPQAAQLLFRAGRELFLDKFDDILAGQLPANVWERRFLTSLERDASTVRHRAIAKLASAGAGFADLHRDAIAKIADALRMVRQSGTHGLVPLFLILEDYRALLA